MLSPQLQQLINLFLLLLVGKYIAYIYLSWMSIAFVLLFTICIEHFMIYLKEEKLTFLSFSSLTTAIGVMLMMVTPYIWITMTVIAFGLVQKHFLQWQGRHFFNPSNFALMSGLLFFYNDAHIALGQLGDNIWLEFLIIILGVSILYRVNRWIIPLAFTVIYLFLQYIFIVCSDPVLIMEEVYYRFYSVSFIVFIFFMLTDPKTTPENAWMQILFSVAIASGATFMDYYYGFRVQHLFMSLFICSTTVPLFMNWEETYQRKRLILMSALMLLLSLGAIIYIEIQPPYYLEMDG